MGEKTVRCGRGELSGGLPIETGSSYRFELTPPVGVVSVLLRDARGYDPVPGVAYEITGPHDVHLEGKTSPEGAIRHEDPPVPIDHYDLAVLGRTFKVDARDPDLGPQIVRVPGWPEPAAPFVPADPDPEVSTPVGIVHVLVRDHRGYDPVPGEPYSIAGPHDVKLEGKTTAEGEIRHDAPVPIDHYDLTVLGRTFKVDARDPDLGPLVVRVPFWPEREPVVAPTSHAR